MSDLAQTSVYLNQQDRERVARLMKRYEASRSGVVRLALQRLEDETDGRDARIRELAEEIKRLA